MAQGEDTTAKPKVQQKSKGKVQMAPGFTPWPGDLPASNDPKQLSSALTPNLLNQQTHSAVALKYNPAESQIGKEVGISQLQQKRIKSWFGDYIDTLRTTRDQSRQQQGQALTRSRNLMNTGYNTDLRNNRNLMNVMGQDAAYRGATPSADNAILGQQAAASRRNLLGSQLTGEREHSAIWNNYMQSQVAQGKASKVAAQLGEHQHRADLATALRNLKQQEGDFAVLFRSQTLSDYQKQQLAAKIANFNQNLAVSKLKVSQQLANSSTSTAAGRLTLAQQQAAETARHNKAQENINQQKKNKKKKSKPDWNPSGDPTGTNTNTGTGGGNYGNFGGGN